MLKDFLFSFLVGWFFLFVFWLVVIVFINIRKPPKSKLTNKLVLNSLLIFFLGFILLVLFINNDSFFL